MGSEFFFAALSDLTEHLRECRHAGASEAINSDLVHRLHHVVHGALRFERALRDEDPNSEVADQVRTHALALADSLRRMEIASTRSVAERAIENRLQSGYLELCTVCRKAVSLHNERFLPWFDAATQLNGT